MRIPSATLALLLALPALAGNGMPVATAPIEHIELREDVRAYGRVEERPQYLYFETTGYLNHLAVDVGDRVKAGDVLARLDSRDVDNRLRQAQEGLKHARTKYEQMRELSTRQAASRDELEDRRYAFELQQLELERLREEHARHLLRAPADGRIVDRLVDFAGPIGADTPVFRLRGAAQPLRVEAELTQREVLQVAIGDPARVQLPDRPGVVLAGTVRKRHPASADDGLFPVQIDLAPLPAGVALEAGMQVEVAIGAGERRRGYAIPVTALLAIDGGNGRFFVVDGERAKAIQAPLARIAGGRVMVDADLGAYSRVVVRGQHQVVDGTPLAPATDAAASR